MCPEGMGSWGQSREIFQSWDTGKGAVVPARKYSLTPVSYTHLTLPTTAYV